MQPSNGSGPALKAFPTGGKGREGLRFERGDGGKRPTAEARGSRVATNGACGGSPPAPENWGAGRPAPGGGPGRSGRPATLPPPAPSRERRVETAASGLAESAHLGVG